MTEAKEAKDKQVDLQAIEIAELETYRKIGNNLYQQGVISSSGGLKEKMKDKLKGPALKVVE